MGEKKYKDITLRSLQQDFKHKVDSENKKEGYEKLTSYFRWTDISFVGRVVEKRRTKQDIDYAVVTLVDEDWKNEVEAVVPASIEVEKGYVGTFKGNAKVRCHEEETKAYLRMNVHEFTRIPEKEFYIEENQNPKNFPTENSRKVLRHWYVAVISSDSHGFRDAERVLKKCPYITYSLYPCNLSDPLDIAKRIKESGAGFDLLLVVRGGGTKLYLFDHPEIAKAIQNQYRFVVTGLGHTLDKTNADLVADHSEDVPASAARYIINEVYRIRNGQEGELESEEIRDEPFDFDFDSILKTEMENEEPVNLYKWTTWVLLVGIVVYTLYAFFSK